MLYLPPSVSNLELQRSEAERCARVPYASENVSPTIGISTAHVMLISSHAGHALTIPVKCAVISVLLMLTTMLTMEGSCAVSPF